MDKELLKTSLNSVWALVYRAAQHDLDYKKLEELRWALSTIRNGWPDDDTHFGRANLMCDWVDMSGILSVPSRKPQDTEAIMQDCQFLQRYLESN